MIASRAGWDPKKVFVDNIAQVGTVTDGKGDLTTIYDRLRKSSLRSIDTEKKLSRWAKRCFNPRWCRPDHEAYVMGVRDAYNALIATAPTVE